MTARFYAGLAPWFVFAVVTRTSGQGPLWAAVAALGAAIAVVVWQSGFESATMLNIAAIALFAGLAVAGLVADPDHLQAFGRAYAAGGLTLVAFGSLAAKPFVGHYTKDLVPADRLTSERFRMANRAITGIWAVAFGAITASFVVAAVIGTAVAATVFNWLVPAAVAVTAMTKASARWDEDFHPGDESDAFDSLRDVLGT